VRHHHFLPLKFQMPAKTPTTLATTTNFVGTLALAPIETLVTISEKPWLNIRKRKTATKEQTREAKKKNNATFCASSARKPNRNNLTGVSIFLCDPKKEQRKHTQKSNGVSGGVDAVIASAAVVLSLPLPVSVGCTYENLSRRRALLWQKPETAPSGDDGSRQRSFPSFHFWSKICSLGFLCLRSASTRSYVGKESRGIASAPFPTTSCFVDLPSSSNLSLLDARLFPNIFLQRKTLE